MLSKKFVLLFLILFSSVLCSYGYQLDMSVDEEIQKKYNSSKLNYEVLPNLPKVNSTTSSQSSAQTKKSDYSLTAPVITMVDKSTARKIPRWTKFPVKSNQNISDGLREGAYVTFTTTAPVYKKHITIPAGTKLTGLIVDSHTPQITGNGGLVVIRITSLTFSGKTYEVRGKITKANTKKIFLNNIKGKHKYWAGVNKQINKGEIFYNKSRQLSNKFSNNPILLVLSPIPTVVGIAGYAANTIVSPVCAIFTKGGTLSIPAGSQFEIKLLEDAYIEK